MSKPEVEGWPETKNLKPAYPVDALHAAMWRKFMTLARQDDRRFISGIGDTLRFDFINAYLLTYSELITDENFKYSHADDLVERLIAQARVNNSPICDEAAQAIQELTLANDKHKVMRRKLDKRIHCQRKAFRDNWEIVERRRSYMDARYYVAMSNKLRDNKDCWFKKAMELKRDILILKVGLVAASIFFVAISIIIR